MEMKILSKRNLDICSCLQIAVCEEPLLARILLILRYFWLVNLGKDDWIRESIVLKHLKIREDILGYGNQWL